jgi:hypothetical protein
MRSAALSRRDSDVQYESDALNLAVAVLKERALLSQPPSALRAAI